MFRVLSILFVYLFHVRLDLFGQIEKAEFPHHLIKKAWDSNEQIQLKLFLAVLLSNVTVKLNKKS